MGISFGRAPLFGKVLGIYVKDLTELVVTDAEKLADLMDRGQKSSAPPLRSVESSCRYYPVRASPACTGFGYGVD